MSPQGLLLLADCCESATVIISLVAYVPQWTTLYRNRSSENVSLKSWSLWLFSACLGWIYAYLQYHTYGTGMVLIVTSTIGIIFVSLTIGMIFRYRPADLDRPYKVRLARAETGSHYPDPLVQSDFTISTPAQLPQ